MSTFLSPQPFGLPAGVTQATIQSTVDGKLTAQGWQRITYDTVNFISDFIPPVTETTGDGKFRQVARIYYNTADISVSMYDYPIVDVIPQMYRLWNKTAGAVAAAVTINGVVVTGATGSTGSTSNDNLAALYVALRQSVDPSITDWNIVYLPNLAGVDSILLERRTISSTLITITPNANVNGDDVMTPVTAGVVSNGMLAASLNGKFSVTIDRANGFYVYMGIFSRSFHFGIKTTTSFYGVIGAYWMPNADAVANTPLKPSWLLNSIAHIQEGFYYLTTGTAAAPTAAASVKSSCGYGMCYNWTHTVTSSTSFNASGEPIYNAGGGGGGIPGVIQSWTPNYHFNIFSDTWTAYSYGLTQSSSGSSTSDVSNLAVAPTPYNPGNIDNFGPCIKATNPAVYMEDVFAASIWNNDASEVTEVAGMPSPTGIALAQDLDATTAYTSILLNTAAGLASSGTNFIVIDQEVFSYTGISVNTLTGVTRGYNATTQRAHFTGQVVLQGGWFVKINGGFLYMGTNRPTAA